MFMVINILALVLAAAVVYIGAVLGFFRSLVSTVSAVLAGILAFGLYGPLAALLPAGSTQSVWYYAADALVLWALFSVLFLVFRTAATRLLPARTELPRIVDGVLGGVVAAPTAFLLVGLCVILAQMLPMPPAVLGYEAFTFDEAAGRAPPGEPLWIKWDRGTLAFFGYLSGSVVGSEEASFLGRYGDVYVSAEKAPRAVLEAEAKAAAEEAAAAAPAPPAAPAPGAAPEGAAAEETPEPAAVPASTPDVDDFLYYHWYRRYQYILWRAGSRLGPIPRTVGEESGIPLKTTREADAGAFRLTILSPRTVDEIEDFADVKPAEGREFITFTLEMEPKATAKLPLVVRTTRFVLADPESGERYGFPRVTGKCDDEEAEAGVVPEVPEGVEVAPLNLRFAGTGRTRHYLMDGAEVRFAEAVKSERRTLVFEVPKGLTRSDMRLYYVPLDE